MKKILATLLVAVMVLSLVPMMAFAATPSVYTIESFPYAGMTDVDNDGAAYLYYNGILDKYNVKEKSGDEITAEPVFSAVWTAYYDETEATVPTSVGVGETVVFPILTEDVGTVNVYVSWDVSALKFDGVYGDYTPNYKDLDEETGKAQINGLTTGATDVTGAFIGVKFTVLDSKKGATDGTGTTKISFTQDPINATENRAQVAATVGVSEMTVNVSGLTPGSDPEPSEKTDMTADDLGSESAPIAAPASKLDASGFTTDAASNPVVSGDGADVTTADKYSCVFATITVGEDKNAPAAIGMVLIDAEGAATFYEAKNAVDGKFGIAFFGTETTLGLYKAAPAVKLSDGTLVYDADNAAAL